MKVNSPKKFFAGLGLAAAVLATPLIFSSQKSLAAPCQDKPTTTIINDVDGSGNPYDVQSDGLGSYVNGTGGVSSLLVCNGYNSIHWGDWQFTTYNSTTRKVQVNIDTADAVQPGDSHFTTTANPPFWGGKLDKGRLEVKCTLINHDMLTMTAGQGFNCPGIIRFPGAVGSSQDYRLVPGISWQPSWTETTDIWVACNATDSGGCKDWSITPIAGSPAVGRLVPVNQTQTPNLGDWYLSFSYHVTRP